MQTKQQFATQNDCYKANGKLAPKGIMVHSTGANNPYLKRYVQPDDGLLGVNKNGNHFNTPRPGGRKVCVHAFIGKLKDGTVACYQTLPWTMRGWHAGGKANDTHIGFEICEDDLTDKKYFEEAYNMAVDLCVHLCREFGLTEQDIIDHSEGYKKGIASNHGDIGHWLKRYGKTMDDFRGEVKSRLEGEDMLKRGDKGDHVKYFQQLLLKAGYNLEHYGADGSFGGVTERAVKALQKDAGLPETGRLDIRTIIALVDRAVDVLGTGLHNEITKLIKENTDIKTQVEEYQDFFKQLKTFL